eukprot:3925988-Alexandrium_andersonii.AAC.1
MESPECMSKNGCSSGLLCGGNEKQDGRTRSCEHWSNSTEALTHDSLPHCILLPLQRKPNSPCWS